MCVEPFIIERRYSYSRFLRRRSVVTMPAETGCGVHPAMLLAHSRAFVLSMMPGRRRSSIAADDGNDDPRRGG
jgi:hypothetical protein